LVPRGYVTSLGDSFAARTQYSRWNIVSMMHTTYPPAVLISLTTSVALLISKSPITTFALESFRVPALNGALFFAYPCFAKEKAADFPMPFAAPAITYMSIKLSNKVKRLPDL